MISKIQLDRSAGLDDLHEQLFRKLQQAIENGELADGDRLPSEPELALELNISRGTVRRALARLQERGLISRRKGRGTVVTSLSISHEVGRLSGFSEYMAARGHSTSSRLLNLEQQIPGLPLQLLFGEDCHTIWKLVRLRLADDVPAAIETCYINGTLLSREELQDAGERSLYELYRQREVAPAHGTEQVEAIALDAETSRLLEVPPGSATFRRERLIHATSGQLIEFVESIYRPGVFKLRFGLRQHA